MSDDFSSSLNVILLILPLGAIRSGSTLPLGHRFGACGWTPVSLVVVFLFGHQLAQSTQQILLTRNIGLWQVWLYGQLILSGIRVNRRVLCWDLWPRSFIKPSGEWLPAGCPRLRHRRGPQDGRGEPTCVKSCVPFKSDGRNGGSTFPTVSRHPECHAREGIYPRVTTAAPLPPAQNATQKALSSCKCFPRVGSRKWKGRKKLRILQELWPQVQDQWMAWDDVARRFHLKHFPSQKKKVCIFLLPTQASCQPTARSDLAGWFATWFPWSNWYLPSCAIEMHRDMSHKVAAFWFFSGPRAERTFCTSLRWQNAHKHITTAFFLQNLGVRLTTEDKPNSGDWLLASLHDGNAHGHVTGVSKC